jgi:hypothetical protein
LTSPELQEVLRNGEPVFSSECILNGETVVFVKLRNQYHHDPSVLSEKQMEFVKKYEPEAWWRIIFSRSRDSRWPTENLKRCPSCGKALPVGSNFRIQQTRKRGGSYRT